MLAACVHPEARAGYRALDERAYAPAAQHFTRALAARPDDLRAWVALGRAYLALGDAAHAEDAFAHAQALAPRVPELSVYVGHSRELGRDYAGAEAAYREACALAPERAYPQRVLGARLLRWGRADEARAPLARALALDPSHLETHNALAMAAAKSGDLNASEQAFRAGLARFPRARSLWLGLGVVLIAQGDVARALDHYTAFAQAFPRFEPAERARVELLRRATVP